MKVTEPVDKHDDHLTQLRTGREWLDAIAGGACIVEEFFGGIDDLVRRSPDEGWDLLGLVDQYYRRGKLDSPTFGALKTHLQTLLVGNGTHVAMSVPINGAAAAPEDAPPLDPPAIAAIAAPAVGATLRHALAPGDVLRDRYRVQGVLGRGGMGTVFAAIDEFRVDGAGGEQRVALKVLHTEVIQRPKLLAELRREFQYLQSLSHPNIVRVHAFDRDGDLAFFTMEYLSGALLGRLLAAREGVPLYRPYAMAIARDVGAAVAHAHSRSVVHGDLNPGNIFITDGGEVRVLDFGASHQLHRGPWISEFGQRPQIAVATLSHASCQVLEGEVAEARDDVYALACMIYVLLTGRHPFGDRTALQARTARAAPARPAGLRRRQWRELRRGLNFDRDGRPADVQAWLQQLDLRSAAPHLPALQALWTVPARRRHTARWLLAGTAALLAAGLWLATADPGRIDWAEAALHSSLARWSGGGAQPTAHLPQPDPAPVPAAEVIAPLPPHAEGSVAADLPPPAALAPPTAIPTPVTPKRASPAAVGPPHAAAAPPSAPAGPRPRVELAADNVESTPGEPAQIVVHRTRNLRDDAIFRWWTESGTAKSGQDFVPVAAHVEHLPPGQSSLSLAVAVTADPARRAPRNFYVVIDQASDDPTASAAVGPRTLTMVTIPAVE